MTDGERLAENTPHVEREDIHIKVRDGKAALEIGDAAIALVTHYEGAPPEAVEVDHYDHGPFYILDFGEEFGGPLEISPEYIPPEDGDSDE